MFVLHEENYAKHKGLAQNKKPAKLPLGYFVDIKIITIGNIREKRGEGTVGNYASGYGSEI